MTSSLVLLPRRSILSQCRISWGVSFFGVIVVNKLTCGKESRTAQRVALLLVDHGIKCGTPLGAFGQSWAELIYKALAPLFVH